jgi:hypothetical protein
VSGFFIFSNESLTGGILTGYNLLILNDTGRYQKQEMVMELKTFTAMFGDQNVLDFKKLKYKFGPQNLTEYLAALQESFYRELPLLDFKGRRLALLPAKVNLTTQLTTALAGAYSDGKYGIAAMEDEIMATLSIEQIGSTRESVRKILNGGAPIDGNEDKAYGIKRGWILLSTASRIY